MNNQSNFVKEICAEQGISLNFLSQGYVMRLFKNGRARHIFGSYWDINSAAADRIACDKTACFLLLERAGISAVPHELFSARDGDFTRAAKFLDKHKKVIIKPNTGTQGMDIFLCKTQKRLEVAAAAIFEKYSDAALSPFMEIEHEYRVFFLSGQARFIYGKARGDSWQHNLSQGAKAFIAGAAKPETDLSAIEALALRAADCIGINFATIDIAALKNGGLAVMEINSGVQARLLLEQLPHLRPIIKEIYTDALREMFM
ncbi:MAG: ATP-grasp domain-containing protein [Defluviitaleaceae bacterium]|nr:ATP-grasp domain-containing protein [Defluviitaleaceae bacterium]